MTDISVIYAPCPCVRKLPTSARVRRALADLAERFGPDLHMRQAAVGIAANTTRETVNRELGRLEAAGIVRRSGTTSGPGVIHVVDLPALQALGLNDESADTVSGADALKPSPAKNQEASSECLNQV